MDGTIPISAINDFLYCPKSLYLHSVYSSFETNVYHDTPQTRGSIAHENIENQEYTTSKHMLQGLSVFSSRLGLRGKIDMYDTQTKSLIERKYRLKHVYDGYRYQLYAQMYCLEEAGYRTDHLFLQSLSDNKRYKVDLPSPEDKAVFEEVIARMRSFDSVSLHDHTCSHCASNIYSLLNW